MNSKTLTHSSDPNSRLRYRPEIDGLRAIAILAVVVYHFNPSLLPSGFIGVDIFFVISGFVVTYSLAHKPDQPWKDYLLSFAAKRIQRLYPALIVCVVVTGLVGCLFIPTPTISLQTGIAALVGFSNLLLFHRSTDYFGQPANLNLFTQTWSLGVEEEFYIAFPILAGLCGFCVRRCQSGRQRLFLAVLSLSVVSLLGYLHFSRVYPSAAFFLMPVRFWELGAGCLTFLLTQQGGSCPVLSLRMRTVLQGLSVCLLVGLLFVSQSVQVFTTIAAVLLTCCVIGWFDSNALMTRLMSTHGLVSIGRWSYSLYLWHWSVIVLCRWTIGVSRWTLPFQFGAIAALALMSYYWVEKPMRHAQWSPSQVKTIGKGLLSMAIAGLFLWMLAKPLQGTLYSGSYDPELFQSSFPLDSSYELCRRTPQVAANFSDCSYPPLEALPDSFRTLYIVGDSHAAALKALASRFVDDRRVDRVVMTGEGGCFFSMDLERSALTDSPDADCLGLFRAFLAEVISHGRSGDMVLVASRYKLYFATPNHPNDLQRWQQGEFALALDDRRLPLSQGLEVYSDELIDIAHQLAQREIALVVQAPLPDWKQYPIHCQSQWFRPDWALSDACQLSAETEVNVLQPIVTAFRRAESLSSNLHIYNPFPLFCSVQRCSPFLNDGQLVFSDDDHLNNFGASLVYYDLVEFLRARSLLSSTPP